MKLFKIFQYQRRGYDTYSDAVVAAEDAEDAATIHPGGDHKWKEEDETWADTPVQVYTEYLGEAENSIPRGVILALFHNG